MCIKLVFLLTGPTGLRMRSQEIGGAMCVRFHYTAEWPPFRLPSQIGIVPGLEKTTRCQIFSQIAMSFLSGLMVLFSICIDVQTTSQVQNVIRSFSFSEGSRDWQRVSDTETHFLPVTGQVNYCGLLLALLFRLGFLEGPHPSPLYPYCKSLNSPGASA